MDDEIAGRKSSGLGNEILGAFGAAAGPGEAFAEDILLADEGDILDHEAALDAQDGEGAIIPRHRADSVKRADRRLLGEAVIGQNAHQPVARTFGPAGDDDLEAALLQRADMLDNTVKDIGVLGRRIPRAFRGERAARLRAERNDRRLSPCGKAKGERRTTLLPSVILPQSFSDR